MSRFGCRRSLETRIPNATLRDRPEMAHWYGADRPGQLYAWLVVDSGPAWSTTREPARPARHCSHKAVSRVEWTGRRLLARRQKCRNCPDGWTHRWSDTVHLALSQAATGE